VIFDFLRLNMLLFSKIRPDSPYLVKGDIPGAKGRTGHRITGTAANNPDWLGTFKTSQKRF
jgi:hypothetical protein